MRLVALQKVWYAGAERNPGDEFDCDDRDFIMILSAPDLPGGPKVAKVDSSQPEDKSRPQVFAPDPPQPPPPAEETPVVMPPGQPMTTENAGGLIPSAAEPIAAPRRYYRRRQAE